MCMFPAVGFQSCLTCLVVGVLFVLVVGFPRYAFGVGFPLAGGRGSVGWVQGRLHIGLPARC